LIGELALCWSMLQQFNFDLCLLKFNRRLVVNLTQNVERFTVVALVADTRIILA